jgi:fibronectin type 3 domain-containing protein
MFVSAQSDSQTFRVQVFGGVDTATPTAPVLLSVTPISPNQIDLDWSSSTDNFGVQGYVVYRGTSSIATTSQTSFSDTGLSASTSYSYFVRAFDFSLNYSTSSNVLSTSTLDVPPPPLPPTEEVETETSGRIVRIPAEDLTIVSGISTTSITLSTPRPTKLSLRWGRTASYEIGYVVNDVFSTDHSIFLTDLEPGTTYEYEIVGEFVYGLEQVVRSGQFTTLELAEPNVPSNVLRFFAFADGSDVQLSWELPPDEDVAFVRVVRSHLSFPAHSQDGAVAYQGLRSGFTDSGILDQYSPVYYTAFVFDAEGNVSSGAVLLVYAEPVVGTAEGTVGVPERTSTQLPGRDGQQPDVIDPVAEATSTIVFDRVTVEMKVPELSQVFVEQFDQRYSFLDSDLTLDPDAPFTLLIPSSAVAGNLKTIVGTLLDPTDTRRQYAFLMRINKDQSAYEATIAPLSVLGRSALTVELYDYEAAVVARYQSPVTFAPVTPPTTVAEDVVFPDAVMERPYRLLLVVLLPLVLGLLLLLLYRARRDG